MIAFICSLNKKSYLCIEIINRDTDGLRVVQSPRQLNPRF